MNRLIKLAAVAVSASLLLFGCSYGSGNSIVANNTADEESSNSVKNSTSVRNPGGMEDVADIGNASIDVASLTFNENIHVNQIGYHGTDIKQVIVNGKAVQFVIVEKLSGEQIFKGKIKAGSFDDASDDHLYYGDFTKLERSGIYYVAVPGVGLSGNFEIGEQVYGELKNALLKFFYFQRCGMELEKQYASDWAHPTCHTDGGTVYGGDGTKMDGNGGWHDAGDYGKYIVPAANAAADLMMAWEFFPESFADKVNIPESTDSMPDILNEVRYELEWMLKMQDNKTGGVYHKLTSKSFPPLAMMPESDGSLMYFSPVSSAAAGGYAAVMAMASRIFSAYDEQFAKSCLKASEKAWSWIEENKSVQGFKNPGEISTGEYGDSKDADERYWAAAELYRTTGNEVYGEYIKSVYRNKSIGGFNFGWQSMDGFAGIAYIYTDKDKQDNKIYKYISINLLKAADKKLSKSKREGYHITLGSDEYVWGSNMNILNDARLLIFAEMLKPSKGYREAAQNNLNYLLGCNPLNQCYITGFGFKPVTDPHHRPSKADSVEQPVPGMVAGGPNTGLEDDFAKMNLKDKAPARCYIDYSGSYSTNEVAIYWNSPAVFVTGYFTDKR